MAAHAGRLWIGSYHWYDDDDDDGDGGGDDQFRPTLNWIVLYYVHKMNEC